MYVQFLERITFDTGLANNWPDITHKQFGVSFQLNLGEGKENFSLQGSLLKYPSTVKRPLSK